MTSDSEKINNESHGDITNNTRNDRKETPYSVDAHINSVRPPTGEGLNQLSVSEISPNWHKIGVNQDAYFVFGGVLPQSFDLMNIFPRRYGMNPAIIPGATSYITPVNSK